MNLFEVRKEIETSVLKLLNTNAVKLISSSPRSVGDGVQEFLEQHIGEWLPADKVKNTDTSFARRAMADLAFEDNEGGYYVVDVKTHNLDTKFNMPNLTSVERLARFYGDAKNSFVVLLISYDKSGFKECSFVPIEFLDWECLTIGALGWGQILSQ